MEVIYSINGKYFKTFGVYISESKGLLDKLKPKPRKAYDWAEYHGKVVDLSAPKYEEREITLTGWIEGKNWHEMKQNFDALLSEFDKGGLVRLLVEFGKELVYDVYLDGAVELEKTFKEGEIIGKFSLKLKEPNPVKKVLRLVGNNLSLSFSTEDWVEINIDGINESKTGNILINKVLQSKEVGRLEFGGRNFFRNSQQVLDLSVPKTDYLLRSLPISPSLVNGEEYILSFDLETFENRTAVLWFNFGITTVPYLNFDLKKINTVNGRVSIKFISKGESTLLNIYNVGYASSNERRLNNAFIASNFKLEKGNKSTDWTPAPEETHYITIAGNIDKIKNLQTNAEELW